MYVAQSINTCRSSLTDDGRLQIKRPTDLKSLCLTCKDLRDVATPPLYRSVQLLIGGQQDMRLSAMLNPSNPGLPHVRRVYLRLESMAQPRKVGSPDDSSDENDEVVESSIRAQFAQFTTRMLLDFLPEDILECFNWQPWDPLSNENFILLCKKQRKLHDIDIGPMTRPLDPDLAKEPQIFERLTSLKRIDLYPDSVDRLHAAHRLIRAQPNIECFHLCTGFEYNRRETHPDDLQDSSTAPGRITSTLFAHMLPFETCTPYTLKALILDDIELRYAADTWMKIIQFPLLEKLVVIRCAGVENVFAALSKPHQRPTKLKILRWMDDDKSQPHTLEAFEGLLQATNGLEILSVWIGHMTGLPKVGAICAHKRTLVSLAVQSRDRREDVWTYSGEDFNRLCTECTELRQLSVMFPDAQADDSVQSIEFRTFVVCTPCPLSLILPAFKHAYSLAPGNYLPPALSGHPQHLSLALPPRHISAARQGGPAHPADVRAPAAAHDTAHIRGQRRGGARARVRPRRPLAADADRLGPAGQDAAGRWRQVASEADPLCAWHADRRLREDQAARREDGVAPDALHRAGERYAAALAVRPVRARGGAGRVEGRGAWLILTASILVKRD